MRPLGKLFSGVIGNGKTDYVKATLPQRTEAPAYMANFLSPTIQVRIYEKIGGNPVIVHNKPYSYRQDKIHFRGGIYVLNKDTGKVLYEKDRWGRIIPTLMFIMHDPAPMGFHYPEMEPTTPEESGLRNLGVDARKVAQIANAPAWKNALPNGEQMLQLIVMVSVVGLLLSVALNAYLLTDPNASENLRNILTSEARQQQQQQAQDPPNNSNRQLIPQNSEDVDVTPRNTVRR